MAKVAVPPGFVERLCTALRKELRSVGIYATLTSEAIEGTKLYRISAVAKKFEALRHSERQDLVWRIAEQTLQPDEQLRISMILTLTPGELRGE